MLPSSFKEEWLNGWQIILVSLFGIQIRMHLITYHELLNHILVVYICHLDMDLKTYQLG